MRDPLIQLRAEWAEYLDFYTHQLVTALRTGGRPPTPPELTVRQTAGAELAHYLGKGLPNYAEVAVANLEMRARRNELAGHYLNNAQRWRDAARLIREAAERVSA